MQTPTHTPQHTPDDQRPEACPVRDAARADPRRPGRRAAALAVLGLMAAAGLAAAEGVASAAPPPAAAPEGAGTTASAPAAGVAAQRRWRCDAAYLPARSTWPREVLLRWDAQQLREVLIDGQPVHSFHVQGTELATSLDNERIVFDTATLTWQSDFRGLARGQGRCEALP